MQNYLFPHFINKKNKSDKTKRYALCVMRLNQFKFIQHLRIIHVGLGDFFID
jgi:hypothetical protein